MKVVKSQVLMYMHEKLLLEKELKSNEVKEMFELEDKTFYRYIQEIKAYYSNLYKDYLLVYSRGDKKYFLERKE